MQFYALFWTFLQLETAQRHLLSIIWTILKITVYKIFEQSNKHVTYFVIISVIVNELLNFKITEFFMKHKK